jgi:hypothetical protein
LKNSRRLAYKKGYTKGPAKSACLGRLSSSGKYPKNGLFLEIVLRVFGEQAG